MPLYEVTLTAAIEAKDDADVDKKRAIVQKMLVTAKSMLLLQGVKVVGDIAVGKAKIKA